MGRERDRSRDRGRRSRSRERRRSRSRDRSRDRSRRSRSRDRGKGSSAGPPPVAFLPPPVAVNFAETNPQMQALAAMQQQQAELQRQQMLQSLLLQQQALASIPGVTIGAIGTPAGTNAPSAATKKAREIYVGNLSVGVMSADLVRELFNSALANFVPDPVTNPPIVEVKMDTTGRFCFVETRTLELAAHLMELDKMEVNGRPLKIGRPKGYEDEALKLQSQQKLSMAQTFAAQLSGADTNVVLLENLMPAKNMLDPTERREIYDDVFSEAAKCGPVAGAAVPVPSPDVPEDEPCRVYVKYHSVEDAKRCKEMMDGRSFDDRILKASFSNDYDFTRAQQGEWIQSAPAIQQVALPQATLPQATLPQVPGLAGLPPGVTIPVLPIVTMPDLTGLGGGLPHY